MMMHSLFLGGCGKEILLSTNAHYAVIRIALFKFTLLAHAQIYAIMLASPPSSSSFPTRHNLCLVSTYDIVFQAELS